VAEDHAEAKADAQDGEAPAGGAGGGLVGDEGAEAGQGTKLGTRTTQILQNRRFSKQSRRRDAQGTGQPIFKL